MKETGIGGFATKGDINIDLRAMMKYHDKFIYPTDYQLVRIINLLMILSGTLFEMLKIYNPDSAKKSQADYTSVDDKDEAFHHENEDDTNSNQDGKKHKNKSKKKKNRRKSEPKKDR